MGGLGYGLPMRAVDALVGVTVVLVSACANLPREAPAPKSQLASRSGPAHDASSVAVTVSATAPGPAPETSSSDGGGVAVEPPADPCRPTTVPRGARAWLVFVGEFVRTEEDGESGYAEALRRFYFKPLKSWHGLASADETGGVMFVPNPGQRSSLAAPPHFARGQQVFVVVDRGGMSGQMNVLAEAIPVKAAQARIEALGAPCWNR